MPQTSFLASGDARESEPASSRNRRAQVGLLLVIAIAVVLLTLNVVRLIGDSALIDARVYLGGAQLLLADGGLYDTRIEAGGIGLPFTYPPFAAILFVGVFAGSLLPGVLVLTIAGLGGLFVALLLIVRRLDADLRRGLAIAAVATAVATWLEPAAETIDFVQINLILLAMVTIDCLGRARYLPRGLLVGLATAVKLTPAIFVLFFLARRDGRAVAWTGAGFLAATGIGWLIAPADSTRYWFDTLNDSGRIGNLAYVGNQSLRGAFARLIDDETLRTIAWAVSAVLVVAVGWWLAARLRSAGQDVLALCAVALTGLLVSPVSWSHHWVWLIPVLVVLWCRQPGGRPGLHPEGGSTAGPADSTAVGRGWLLVQRGSCIALACYLVLGMHWWLPGVRDRGQEWSGWQQILAADYVLGGVAGLGLLVVLALRYRPGGRRLRRDANEAGGAEITAPIEAGLPEQRAGRAAGSPTAPLVPPTSSSSSTPPTAAAAGRGAGPLDPENQPRL